MSGFWQFLAVSLLTLVVAPEVSAEDQRTFQSFFDSISSDANCTKSEYENFVLFTCDKELTLWYFTKPNHPAYPGVIQRTIVQNADGSISAQEHGTSFASDAAQPAFKAWLAQIVALDKQVHDSFAAQNRPHN